MTFLKDAKRQADEADAWRDVRPRELKTLRRSFTAWDELLPLVHVRRLCLCALERSSGASPRFVFLDGDQWIGTSHQLVNGRLWERTRAQRPYRRAVEPREAETVRRLKALIPVFLPELEHSPHLAASPGALRDLHDHDPDAFWKRVQLNAPPGVGLLYRFKADPEPERTARDRIRQGDLRPRLSPSLSEGEVHQMRFGFEALGARFWPPLWRALRSRLPSRPASIHELEL